MLGETSKRTRLFFIDNLGILLITLVVVFHLSVTYGRTGIVIQPAAGPPPDL